MCESNRTQYIDKLIEIMSELETKASEHAASQKADTRRVILESSNAVEKRFNSVSTELATFQSTLISNLESFISSKLTPPAVPIAAAPLPVPVPHVCDSEASSSTSAPVPKALAAVKAAAVEGLLKSCGGTFREELTTAATASKPHPCIESSSSEP